MDILKKKLPIFWKQSMMRKKVTVQKSSQIWYVFLYDKILFYFFIFFWDTFYK